MSLVDPYHDRYFDKNTGQVVGVRYDGPVGNVRMTKTNLGLGIPSFQGSSDAGQFDILTPPGSTEEGKFDVITPPGSPFEGIFQKLFSQALERKLR